MLHEQLQATIGRDSGKGPNRTLRRKGFTPAILYGPKTPPVRLALDTKTFTKLLFKIHQKNAVITLNINDSVETSSRHVMVKELQTDPIQDTLLHADFYEISLDDEVTLPVPLRYVGKAIGVDHGGDLLVAIHVVKIKGRPLDIPDAIEIDVSGLDMNESLLLKDVKIPEQVKLKTADTLTCVSVVSPRAEV